MAESELVVTDIKTSGSRWSTRPAEEPADQLLLYSELTGPLAPEKQMKLQFAVLTKTKTPTLDRVPVAFSSRRVEPHEADLRLGVARDPVGALLPGAVADELCVVCLSGTEN